MANDKKAVKQEKRRRILDAAIKKFSQSGFYRTRISDIARSANVADGTVYLYFGSKEDILGAIFQDSMDTFLGMAKKELATVSGALPRLRTLLDLQLKSLGANRELSTIFQIELRHSARFMGRYSRSRLRDYFLIVRSILEQGKAEGIVNEELDTWFATKCIFGILDEAVTNWVLSDRNYRLHVMLDPIMAFVLGGIRPQAGG